MNKKSISTLTVVAFLLSALPAYAANQSSATNGSSNLERAAQYFEDELSFKTNPHGVKMALDGKVKNVTIVDVRTAADYAKGHIPGAINLPYDKFNNFDGAAVEFPGLRKDGYNYIYCYELLCNLGQKAAKQFATGGYPVKEIVGGFKSWEEKNYPVEKN